MGSKAISLIGVQPVVPVAKSFLKILIKMPGK